MQRVKWNGLPLDDQPDAVPARLRDTIFEYLPQPVTFTPIMDELANKYIGGQITGRDYAAMQSAAFLKPKSKEAHRERRDRFHQLAKQLASDGFRVPDTFRTLVEKDEYVNRLHHNNIWLEMPEELWQLPADTSQMVFLIFRESQGCCYWHLLLDRSGTHSVVCCEHPFGIRSGWMGGDVPDYSEWTVERCADSVEEWLYHYFVDCELHNEMYLAHLAPYHDSKSDD